MNIVENFNQILHSHSKIKCFIYILKFKSKSSNFLSKQLNELHYAVSLRRVAFPTWRFSLPIFGLRLFTTYILMALLTVREWLKFSHLATERNAIRASLNIKLAALICFLNIFFRTPEKKRKRRRTDNESSDKLTSISWIV